MTDSPGRLLSKEEREIPRRIQVQKMTPAELSIRAAVDEVEKLPPDQRLTSAVRLLQMARERVADFVDGKPEEEWARRGLDNLASAFAADDLADALLASKGARIAELEAMLAEQAARLAEAKEALEPFVTVPGVETLRAHDDELVRIPVRWGNLRRAARAYGKLTDD